MKAKRLITITLSAAVFFTSIANGQTIPDRVLLKDIPYIKQIGSYCAPASASMVLKYYGANINQTTLANLSSTASAAHGGTGMDDLSNAVRKMGYRTNTIWDIGEENSKSKSKAQKAFHEITIPQLQKYVSADIPPLLVIQKPAWENSHLIVIIGYDKGASTIMYMDPAVKRSKIHRISYKKLATYSILDYQNGFFPYIMIIEPNGTKRYSKDRKKKDTRRVQNINKITQEMLSYLITEKRNSTEQAIPIEQLLYPTGYFYETNDRGRINYENIDMLPPDLALSRTKSLRYAKKHSIKAIESNLLNNHIVAILFSEGVIDKSTIARNGIQQYMEQETDKKATSNFILLTAYDKTKREFTAYTEKANSPFQYQKVTLPYRDVLDKLNSKTDYITPKGKQEIKYTQRIVTFSLEDDNAIQNKTEEFIPPTAPISTKQKPTSTKQKNVSTKQVKKIKQVNQKASIQKKRILKKYKAKTENEKKQNAKRLALKASLLELE